MEGSAGDSQVALEASIRALNSVSSILSVMGWSKESLSFPGAAGFGSAGAAGVGSAAFEGCLDTKLESFPSTSSLKANSLASKDPV